MFFPVSPRRNISSRRKGRNTLSRACFSFSFGFGFRFLGSGFHDRTSDPRTRTCHGTFREFFGFRLGLLRIWVLGCMYGWRALKLSRATDLVAYPFAVRPSGPGNNKIIFRFPAPFPARRQFGKNAASAKTIGE